MSWLDWAQIALNVWGSSQAKKGNNKAADAQTKAAQAAIDEQRRQYDQTRTDLMPWLNAGTGALGQMQSLNSGDFSSFTESPDYKFSFDEGQRALDQGAGARGGLFGGGHTRDTIKYGQGMASQQYNSFYNKLQSMAGQGQTTAGGLGSLGAGMATQIGSQYNNIGNARASAYQNNAYNNAALASNIGGTLGQWYNRNRWGGG